MEKMRHKSPRPSLYGFHAVREAWLNPERTIHRLYITRQAQSGFETVMSQAKNKGLPRPPPFVIEKSELEKMLPKGAVHQGIALATGDLGDIFIQDIIIRAQTQERTALLMLDQVTDPHNVGAVIRTACAFGADGVIMQRKHAPDLTGALAKAACGGIEHVPVIFETNLSRTIEDLKTHGFFVYGLDEHGRKTVGEIERHGKIVLVLGAEGAGLRRLVREKCDELVRLPTSGPIASLNVSNAAAVALYAISGT